MLRSRAVIRQCENMARQNQECAESPRYRTPLHAPCQALRTGSSTHQSTNHSSENSFGRTEPKVLDVGCNPAGPRRKSDRLLLSMRLLPLVDRVGAKMGAREDLRSRARWPRSKSHL